MPGKTERTHLEADLRFAQGQVATLHEESIFSDVLPVLACRASTDGYFLQLNREWERVFGYTRDELLARPFTDFIHPDDLEPTARQVEIQRDGSPTIHFINRYRTKDGAYRWLNWNGSPALNGREIIAVAVDITDAQNAYLEIQHQAERLAEQEELLEHAHVLVRDMDSRIVLWTAGVERLYGWTREEALGQVSHSLLQTQFPVSFAAYQETLMTQEQWEGQLVHTHKDGARVVVASHHVLHRSAAGAPTLILEVNNDITALKRTKDALRVSQQNFAKAFESNPAMLVITRLADGKFVKINAAHTRTIGYEPSELIGRTVADMAMYVDPDGRATVLRLLREQGAVRGHELQIRLKSGEVRDMIAYMEPIQFDGEDCLLSALLDITERKRMEQELRRSNAELEQFAYVASHDLQEPLRAVAGMVQLLEQKYKGRLDERADQYIFHAVEAANRMQALINDLLTYSRVDRRGQPFACTDAAVCVQQALANLDVTLTESGADVTVDPLPTVVADATQLTQVFQNLISNAVKFRRTQEPQVHISAVQAGDAWQFSIRDNGIGIEPQYFDRIFLVFQRLHTRREYPGTGIGLALCKKIVERHGGRIWVESEPGQGSTFHFTIPVRTAP